MKLLSHKYLAGINIHCFRPVIEAELDLEALANRETSEFKNFDTKLQDLLPGLKSHVCGLGKRGGFSIKLQKGTYFGHVVEHVAIELLDILGVESTYGKTRATDLPGVYTVVVQCEWPQTGYEALKTACDIVESLVTDEQYNLSYSKLERVLLSERPGPSTQAVIDAAKSRGIPVRSMGRGSLLRLGTGCYRHYIEATITGLTSCIGVDIACDKTITKEVLSEALIPTPAGRIAKDEDDAVQIASEMQGLVVVKPCDGNQGKGVSLNLSSEAEVRAAYKVAENFSSKLIVEEQISGRHYRILVVNNKVVAAAERFPAQVSGDGIHSLKDLIELENLNPLRGEEHEKPLTKIKADQVMFNVLARQNLTMNYIPNHGETVNLRDNANLSTGGTATDVTDEVHPDNIELAVRASRLLDLDVAGIDIVTQDISEPISQGGGAVIEVNAAPGIRMHLFPSQGKRRPVGDEIVDYLFPWHRRHSVPVVSITGTNGKTTTSRLVAFTLQEQGKRIGLASTDGIYINGVLVDSGDNTGPVSAEVVLSDPVVEVAVLETARGGIVRRGLGYPMADVAVVTNISEDHLGLDGVKTLEELCHVKSLVAEAVFESGYVVLNADDPNVVLMAQRVVSEVIYFSRSCGQIFLRHLSEGGKGVMIKDDKLYLAEGSREEPIVSLKDIAITFGGRAGYNVENCLAAAGALWGLGQDPKAIAVGLTGFNDKLHNPGRANWYDLGHCSVLLDYGHNSAGYKNVIMLAQALAPRRLVGVIGVPGDRRDQDIVEVGRICGHEFDHIYLKEDKDLRNRKPGEVAQLLESGIREVKPGAAVKTISCERKALKDALDNSMEGDLIVVFYEKLGHLQQLLIR